MPSSIVLEGLDLSKASFSSIDKVFWEHCGKGSHELQINGTRCVKEVGQRTLSNSGKNSAFSVTIRIYLDEDDPVILENFNPYSTNRRNDEARNFGLPE